MRPILLAGLLAASVPWSGYADQAEDAAERRLRAELQRRAAEHLGEGADPTEVDAMANALWDSWHDQTERHRHAWAQVEVIQCLVESGDPAAVDQLVEALRDPEWRVCREAAKALEKIGNERATGPLIKVLGGTQDWRVKQQAALALSAIGSPEAIPAFERALVRFDESQDVRSIAAGMLARTDWTPRNTKQKLWLPAARRDWQGLGETYAALDLGPRTIGAGRAEAPFTIGVPIPVPMTGSAVSYGRLEQVLFVRWVALRAEQEHLAACVHYGTITGADCEWELAVRALGAGGQTLGESRGNVSIMHFAVGQTLRGGGELALQFEHPIEVEDIARVSVTMANITAMASAAD